MFARPTAPSYATSAALDGCLGVALVCRVATASAKRRSGSGEDAALGHTLLATAFLFEGGSANEMEGEDDAAQLLAAPQS